MNATFTLDFPDPVLSPNCHKSWRAKDAARQAAILRGKNAAQRSAEFPTADHLSAEVTFYPPDNKRRDLDNLLASCKAYFDGICRGIGIDDRQIKRITVQWGEVKTAGRVTIQLSSMEG